MLGSKNRKFYVTDEVNIDINAYEICANLSGFRALSKLYEDIKLLYNTKIIIDCSRVNWIDAQLGAALLTIVNHARAKKNEVLFLNIRPNVSLILQKNKTLSGSAPDNYGTTIPTTGFPLNGEVNFANFSRNNLARKQMPRMSEGLTRKFFEGIDELFANASLHSRSAIPIFASGQYFPKHSRLSFVISDGGIGIEGSLSAIGKLFPSSSKAVSWAMEMNNSSRIGDIPGGLGLAILKEFIKINNGCLMMCSHRGYWEARGEITSAFDLPLPFPGTVVSLDINTSDRRSYHLTSPVNPHEIW